MKTFIFGTFLRHFFFPKEKLFVRQSFLNEYSIRLDDMNMSDLQAHSSTVGIIPIDNRHTLRERLLREFRKHVASYKKPVHEPKPAEKIDPEVMKILSEGR